MPTSTTRTRSGGGSASKARTTSTPKPSSPRRTLPKPATRTLTGRSVDPRPGRGRCAAHPYHAQVDREARVQQRDPEAVIADLRAQLLRYRADRHPREHATVQFHLGTALITAERPGPAAVALRVARDLFDADDDPVACAKATNMLGAALRDLGDLDAAGACFARADEVFAAHDQPLERGAAVFNRGLVEREALGPEAAIPRFTTALDLFEAGGAAGQASAAARELGAALLAEDRTSAAAEALERAAELAGRAGDRAALGAATNALGLAALAHGDLDGAIAAFHDAVAAHPRGVRPAAHAMAKANLALAHERAGDAPRARLAARQARATPEVPAAVADQAAAILQRLPERSAADDLLDVLADEDPERRASTVRDELTRWSAADETTRHAEMRAWVAAHARWEGDGTDLAESLLDVLLEFPPDGMEGLIAAAVVATDEVTDEVAARFRKDVSAAMGRFHVPQWMRLKDTFRRLATGTDTPEGWG